MHLFSGSQNCQVGGRGDREGVLIWLNIVFFCNDIYKSNYTETKLGS